MTAAGGTIGMSASSMGLGLPYVDVDEWRDLPRRHRYVHGGFEDSHTRFSVYLPPEDLYRGRFFHFLEGGFGGHEVTLTAGGFMDPAAVFDLAFDELGGYLVESNQGHFHNEGIGAGGEVEWFGASAESARHARTIAAAMYGDAPHHGYVWGASGGGVRTIACIENAPDVFDGASPNICGSAGIQQQWSAVGYWWLHCRHRREAIMDAVAPGGTGDPFASLSHAEREALATVYRHGYPRGAEAFLWFAMVWMATIIQPMDYYEEFWTRPGYLGHDDPRSLDKVVIHQKARVTAVRRMSEAPSDDFMVLMALASGASDQQYAIELAGPFEDPTMLPGAQIRIVTGAAAGRTVTVSGVRGSTISGAGESTPELFDGVEPGDEVEVDNRRFVAWCHLHRYCIEAEDKVIAGSAPGEVVLAPEFAGLRAGMVDNRPVLPQSDPPDGGSSYDSGQFAGKMIYVNGTHDSLMWPVGAAAYHRRVRNHLGDTLDDRFRLWWVENGSHGPAELLGPFLSPEGDPGVWRSRFVGFDGASHQALRDLVAWVEDDIAPPPSTSYRFNEDGGLVLAADAGERGGIQPMVRLTVNGRQRADVKAGEPVRFEGWAELPRESGSIVWTRWDFDGSGDLSAEQPFSGSASGALSIEHTYVDPGTYFACLRVGAHREGRSGKGPAVENLARVRVVVR